MKTKHINSICHSERALCTEESIIKDSLLNGLPRPTSGLAMTPGNESGRSLVEMLGVLAVMGILTIGGIAGFNYAMDRSKANDILDGVNKRAIALSSYLMLGTNISATTLDAEFSNHIGDATVALSPAGSGFKMTVSGLTDSVCDQVLTNGLKMASEITLGETKIWDRGVKSDHTCADSDNTISFSFNAALNGAQSATNDTPAGPNAGTCTGNGGTWNADTGSCTCPGRYTGVNCEVAPTACPEGATPTADGKCQMCKPGNEDCATCEVTEEFACFSECKCVKPGSECTDVCSLGWADTVACVNGKCVCDNANAVWVTEFGDEGLTFGECVIPTEEHQCFTNKDCGQSEYCDVTMERRSCQALPAMTEQGGVLVSQEPVNYYAAQNICEGYGKRLPSTSTYDFGKALEKSNGEPFWVKGGRMGVCPDADANNCKDVDEEMEIYNGLGDGKHHTLICI